MAKYTHYHCDICFRRTEEVRVGDYFRAALHRLGFYKLFTDHKTGDDISKTLKFSYCVSLDEYDVCEDCLNAISETISKQREKQLKELEAELKHDERITPNVCD
jgi:hypothetical protein